MFKQNPWRRGELTIFNHASRHRGERIRYLAGYEYRRFTVKNIPVIVVRTRCAWWIVASYAADDDRHTDVGPFKSLKTAIPTLMLMKD